MTRSLVALELHKSIDEQNLPAKVWHGKRGGRPPHPAQLVAEGWSPVDEGNDRVVVETSRPVSDDLYNRVTQRFPDRQITFRRVPSVGLQNRQLDEHTAALADHIAEDFSRRLPQFSVKAGIRHWQKGAAVTAAAAAVAATVLTPRLLFLALVVSSSLVTLTMAVISANALFGRGRRRGLAPQPLTDAQLPSYTILVPAYHEEAVIGDLVRCMHRLDYPTDKLEVLILVERRDLATKAAIAAAAPKPFIRVVELPPGDPQTKPRACNAGLLLAAGELLVIYDAEDRPEPDQLRKAAAVFADGDESLACVQAKLLVHNAARNLITRQFALEYAMRYELTVPGLARMGLPVPLGGTSNHFRTTTLRELGGWDAWNVTEDADLGMRCQAMGYHVGVVDSVTWGESTVDLRTWTGQRTRWLKGFMLTALVHSRHPVRTLRQFRPSGLITLLVVLAGTPLHYLAQSIAFGLWASGNRGVFDVAVPHTAAIALGSLVLGLSATLALQSVAALRSPGFVRVAVFSPMLPVYWVMQWVAAWRAVGQLIRAPFHWDKTPHGATV